MSKLLFLSHAAADGDAALALAQRIEASPTAQAENLHVWVDKRNLRPGSSWQEQIEAALKSSTAFAVYLTETGVNGWVREEVRLGLDRVVEQRRRNNAYPFVPILTDGCDGVDALPAFARQYQGTRLGCSDEGLDELIRAVAKVDIAAPVRLVEEPFMGLEAFGSDSAGLFFGRERESKDLVNRLVATNLVFVVGDSGCGKSSLVRAGLVPAFREGAFADRMAPRRPDPSQWNVVEMRPGRDPFQGLVDGVAHAAKSAGVPFDRLSALGKWIRTRDLGAVRDALRESGSHGARLLLVVDQFEELWRCPDDVRGAFVGVLLGVAGPAGSFDHRIVATMRRDYFNLCNDYPDLALRLRSDGGVFRLGRMDSDDLRAAIEKPLAIAGESTRDASELANAVLKDVTDQPGDLALLEMALTESWQRRGDFDGNLVRAYEEIGRVEGALATAAEDTFTNPSGDPDRLLESERSVAEALFMRLVWIGDAHGATRRIVRREELSADGWSVAQKLATRACRRLLVIGAEGDTAEIAHEELVTQWSRAQGWLRSSATDPTRPEDKRWLDRLMDRAQRPDSLAAGSDLTAFNNLVRRRPTWLSAGETKFVRHSARRGRRQKLMTLGLIGAFVALLSATALNRTNQLRRAREQLAASEFREATQAFNAGHVLPALAHAARANELDDHNVAARHFVTVVASSMRVFHHREAVNSAAISADGTKIVTASADETARVWDATGAAIGVPLQHESTVESAAFSADGTRIVTASWDMTARVWDAGTGAAIGSPMRHDGNLSSAAFSADGAKIVTASGDRTARVWDATTGAAIGPPLQHDGPVVSAEFSVDGAKIVTASWDKTARVWDADTGGAIGAPMRHGQEVRSAAFSPDGTKIVTASVDATARVWDAETGAAIGAPMRHTREVTSATFSADGTMIATASGDGTARVWDARTGEAIGAPLQHDGPVVSAVFTADGMNIVTASSDGTARIWEVRTGNVIGVPLRHEGRVKSLAVSADGTIVTASSDKTARAWYAQPGAAIGAPLPHEDSVVSATFSADGTKIVTASGDHTARVWDARTGAAIGAPLQHERGVTSAAFSTDGTQVVTASSDKTARMWDAGTGAPIGAPLQHKGTVLSAVFSPDGAKIVTASEDGTARVWNARTGATIGAPLQHDGKVVSAAFSADGTKIVTGSWDRTARVWDAQTGNGLGRPLQHEDRVLAAAFSADGTMIVTASSDGTARVWDTEKGAVIGTPLKHEDTVWSVAFSPDGMKVLTASSDNTARVWDARTGKALGPPLEHKDRVLAAAFSPDGTTIVTASSDGTARVWDAGTGMAIGAPLQHDDPVTSAAFSADGTKIVTASWDHTARVWDVVTGSSEDAALLATLAESIAGIRVTDTGALEAIADPVAILDTLRIKAADGGKVSDDPAVEAFIHWYFADSRTRSISALSAMTLDEYERRTSGNAQ